MVLTLHIKKYVNNFFIIISNNNGRVIFFKSAGALGFQNIQKRSQDVTVVAYRAAARFLAGIRDVQIFIKFEGVPLQASTKMRKLLFDALKSPNLQVRCVKVFNKISHNGCRKKK